MSDESLEQPSPLRCVPSFATGGSAMHDLTREQMERIGEHLREENLSGVAGKLLAHDLALRERIAELEAADTAKFLEILKLRSDCDEHCQDWTRAQLSLNHAKTQLATVTQERDNWYGHHANEYERAEALQVRVQELEQECEQDHCDILVCTGCGRTSKHGWIGIVYESTPNSAEEYDTKCPECGSMSLDEDARSVVNELDVCKAQIATAQARVQKLEQHCKTLYARTPLGIHDASEEVQP
jgi:hypothetical protein